MSLRFSLHSQTLFSLQALNKVWNQCELLSKQRYEQSLSLLWMETWIRGKGRWARGRVMPRNLKCNATFVINICCVQTSISHPHYHTPVSSSGIIGYGCSKTHTVTSSYHSIHLSEYKPPCWGPSVGAFRALCRWCPSNAPTSRGPFNLLESQGGRILGSLFWTTCFVLVCLFCRVMRGKSLPQSCSEGAYLLWTITSCWLVFMDSTTFVTHYMVCGDTLLYYIVNSNKRILL